MRISISHICKSCIYFSLFIIFLPACSKNNHNNQIAGVCDPGISFSTQVMPLLNAKCNFIGCHDNNNAAALDNYITVHDGAAQIRASIQAGRMPRNSSLKTAEKSTIICWIDNGVHNN